jgi:hydroxylaminobenzene mutase
MIRRRLAASGAILFAIGMLTGIWSAAAITGKVTVGMPRLALAAHLNGLLGGLWLVAVAWTFEFLSYDVKGLRRLALAVAIPAWANWLVTLVASFFGVNGLEYTASRANNVVAFLLQTLVVIPTLVGAGLWAWGFKSKAEVETQSAE